MPLPNTGDLNWGIPLNDYIINEVQSIASNAASSIANHLAASGDPHGDRAFATAQINALTATYDVANGRAGLGADGRLKPSQAPTGGGKANVYDLIKDFAGNGNGVADNSSALQSALTACAAAGGGEVWVGDGTFVLNAAVTIGANTWLHLSDGATLKRASGSTASYMIKNFTGSSTDTSYGGPGEITITGGNIDGGAVSNSIPCNPIAIAHANDVLISNVNILNVMAAPGITLAGCRNGTVDTVKFQGLRFSDAGVANGTWRNPAVNVDHANSGAVPGGGTYDNTACENIRIQNCTVKPWGTFGSFGKLVDSRNPVANVGHNSLWVVNNQIFNAHEYAIMIVGVFRANVMGNTMVNCNGGVYASVPDGWSFGGSSGVLNVIDVSNNQIYNSGVVNSSDGARARVIYVGGITNGTSNGLYRSVCVSNNQVLVWSNLRAMELFYCVDTVVSGNIIDGGSTTNSYGITLTSSAGTVVSGNKLANKFQYGIYLRTNSDDSTIVGNSIAGAITYAIWLTGSVKISLSGNNTSSTGTTSLQLDSGSAFALGNRWDANSSNSGGTYYTLSSGATSGNLGS